jgi:hypothetical protein
VALLRALEHANIVRLLEARTAAPHARRLLRAQPEVAAQQLLREAAVPAQAGCPHLLPMRAGVSE